MRRNSFFRTEDWAEAARGAKPDDEAVGAVLGGETMAVDVEAEGVLVMRSSSEEGSTCMDVDALGSGLEGTSETAGLGSSCDCSAFWR